MTAKGIASKIGMGIFVVAFLFLGLKSCIGTTWTTPKEPEIYSVQSEDGRRIISIIFLPKNEAMIWHFDLANKSSEGVLTKMFGTPGTHYFCRLWHFDGPGGTFGYRIYPPDTEPVRIEIEVLEKFMSGTRYPGFFEKAVRTNQVLLFGKDVVQWQNMLLRKEPKNPEMIQALLAKLGR